MLMSGSGTVIFTVSWPSPRFTPSMASLPRGLALMILATAVRSGVSTPSTDTMTSPTLRPASPAGVPRYTASMAAGVG